MSYPSPFRSLYLYGYDKEYKGIDEECKVVDEECEIVEEESEELDKLCPVFKVHLLCVT
jgi:hypothetical protein